MTAVATLIISLCACKQVACCEGQASRQCDGAIRTSNRFFLSNCGKEVACTTGFARARSCLSFRLSTSRSGAAALNVVRRPMEITFVYRATDRQQTC